MQPHKRLIWHLVKEVLVNKLPDETSAQRLQQIAILMVIQALQDEGDIITVNTLMDLLELQESQVRKHISSLEKKGLLERIRMHNNMGRGVKFDLRVADTPAIVSIRNQLPKT